MKPDCHENDHDQVILYLPNPDFWTQNNSTPGEYVILLTIEVDKNNNKENVYCPFLYQ